jgi:hypothetical protein
MADTPLTFAEYAKSTPDVLSKACINTLIADDELLSVIPMSLWQGGKSYTWVLNNSGPTIAAIDETTVLYSSKPTRHTVTAYLTQYGGEVEIPVFLDSSMAMNVAGWTEDVADLIRAFGQWLRSKIIVGDYMTEANATVIPFNSSAKPGIDAITTLSANMGVGEIWFKYVHVGTLLSMKAPGSSSYGTAQAVADGAMTFADGDDTTKTVTVTIDASDYTDLAENTTRPGITTVRPESIAGLRYLATLDSAQTWAPSTDGDAITLAALDKLDEMCLGPRNEKIFLMNARTRRAVNTLQRAAGGAGFQGWHPPERRQTQRDPAGRLSWCERGRDSGSHHHLWSRLLCPSELRGRLEADLRCPERPQLRPARRGHGRRCQPQHESPSLRA